MPRNSGLQTLTRRISVLSLNSFSYISSALRDIRFPGDRRNCVKCHVPGANEPPLPAGLLPTLIPQADGTVKALQPIMSSCVGCHTAEPAKLHMETMTFNGQESCVTCHGVARTFAVNKVHQR